MPIRGYVARTHSLGGGMEVRSAAVLAASTCLVLASIAFGASTKTEAVKFQSGSESVVGYLAAPALPGRHPGLIVLHEESGLTDWMKEQTRRLAAAGYVALALDFYHGQVVHDPAIAYAMMAAVPQDRALRDMEAAIHFLIARRDVNKDKIGSIGWSAGGKWSLLLAVNDQFLGACVSNYGAPPTDPVDIQKIRAPVLAIFAAADRYIAASDIDNFAAALDRAHKSVDIKVYAKASPGFANPGNKLDYREDAAEDAWKRSVAFLDEHLK